MNRWLSLLLLAATLAVAALFCVIVIDEREQAYRTLLNQAEPQRFGITWNRPNLIEPGVYLAIPGICTSSTATTGATSSSSRRRARSTPSTAPCSRRTTT